MGHGWSKEFCCAQRRAVAPATEVGSAPGSQPEDKAASLEAFLPPQGQAEEATSAGDTPTPPACAEAPPLPGSDVQEDCGRTAVPADALKPEEGQAEEATSADTPTPPACAEALPLPGSDVHEHCGQAAKSADALKPEEGQADEATSADIPTQPASAEAPPLPGSDVHEDCGQAAKSADAPKPEEGGEIASKVRQLLYSRISDMEVPAEFSAALDAAPSAVPEESQEAEEAAPALTDERLQEAFPPLPKRMSHSSSGTFTPRSIQVEEEKKVDSELLEAGLTAMNSAEGQPKTTEAATKGKGKGKGKSKMPPPPKAASAAPKPKAAAAKRSASGGAGMSALLSKVEDIGKKKDLEESKEIEDIDLSQIDPTAARERVTCPRCEKEVLKEQFESHMTAHSSEILPWLFLGGKRNLENDKELTVRTNITHILNLAQEVNLKEAKEDDIGPILREYNRERGLPFEYKKISFGDTKDQDIRLELDGALQFIHEAHTSDERHNVLVVCVQGISRSSSVVLGYLMKYEKMSLLTAYDYVRSRRTVADPRKEFVDQLATFECELFGLERPTLTGDIAFEGRTLLNVDDPLPPAADQSPAAASASPAAESSQEGIDTTFDDDISNQPPRPAAQSVSDWYAEENPANTPSKIKSTTEWYLDDKPRPSNRTSETEVHELIDAAA